MPSVNKAIINWVWGSLADTFSTSCSVLMTTTIWQFACPSSWSDCSSSLHSLSPSITSMTGKLVRHWGGVTMTGKGGKIKSSPTPDPLFL